MYRTRKGTAFLEREHQDSEAHAAKGSEPLLDRARHLPPPLLGVDEEHQPRGVPVREG